MRRSSAGQDLSQKVAAPRRFRNVRYVDIGTFLRDATKKYFKRTGPEIAVKSIDPSYTIGGIQQIAMTQPSACSWDTAQFMLE